MKKQVIAIGITASLLCNSSSVYGNASNSNMMDYNRPFTETESILNLSNNPMDIIKDSRLSMLEKQVAEKTAENERIAQEKTKLVAQQKERSRIDNVKFDSYDLRVVSGITHEEMANILAHSHYANFAEFSDAFVDAERAYGVNAFALVAIPGLESGWNTSNRAKDGNNNIVGMNVPVNASRGTVYRSKYSCIMDLAMQLKNYYLIPGAEHWNGPSTSQINKKYSASSDWYKQVDSIGDELMSEYNELYKR